MEVRPADQYVVNRALHRAGLVPIVNFDSESELSLALDALTERLSAASDRATIKAGIDVLKRYTTPGDSPEILDRIHDVRKDPSPTEPLQVTLEVEVGLTQEGLARLESRFGRGVGTKRLLVDGGTSLNNILREV
jgi:hypothetical protein